MYTFSRSIHLQFPFPPFLMLADLPCPSRNLTALGSPQARSENIISYNERWKKMNAVVDISDIGHPEILLAISR